MVALVDAFGRLSRFVLLAGHRHESPAAAGLLSGLSFGALLADRGFDSDRLRALLAALRAEAVVPPKSNRKEAIDCDMEKYQAAPRGELLLPDQELPPRRHALRPDRVELRRDDPHRRHLARAGVNVNAP